MGIEVIDQIPLPKDHEFLDEIQEVGVLAAKQIITTYRPYGRYWVLSGLKYVAIDNTTGDAWTEEFDDKETMLSWLRGEFEMSGSCPLKPGDWVIYTNSARKEIGVVKRMNVERGTECLGCPSYFVWYHEGDTAACTPSSTLERIESPDQFTQLVKNAYAIPSLIEKRKEILK